MEPLYGWISSEYMGRNSTHLSKQPLYGKHFPLTLVLPFDQWLLLEHNVVMNMPT